VDEFTIRDQRRLAFELGRAYERELIAAAVDDIRYAVTLPVPRFSYEERVAARVAVFERCALAVAAQIEAERHGQPRAPWGCCT
jgi:hypothetical protein